MAEAHDPLVPRERLADPLLRVTTLCDRIEHRQHARGRPSVKRARERAHGGRQCGAAVGAGRRDRARGERRGVEAVLGRADPVRVDRLRRLLVRLASPCEQEALRGRPAGEHRLLRHGRTLGAPSRLRDDRERSRGEPPEILLRLLVVDVDQLAELPLPAEDGEHRLQVGHVAARAHLELAIGGGEAGLERLVDEKAPDVLERDIADELLDVDAAIAQRAAFAVGLGDLRLDGDDTCKAGNEFVHAGTSSNSISLPTPRSFAARTTSAAAARSWTATPTDLYNVISSSLVRPGRVPATTSPSSTTASGSMSASSGAPAGGGASADSRDSTQTTSAPVTIARSSSEPGAL